MNSERNVVPFILMALFCALFLMPSPAAAYCVYNHTNTDFHVCGEPCHKCYNNDIESGEHGCCPGGHSGCRGHTYITVTPYVPGISSDYAWYVPIQVTNHGWVSLFGKCHGSIHDDDYCDDVTAKVHDNDGNVIYHGGLYHLSGWHRCRDD